MSNQYKVLFSDIGGVLLSNGWPHQARMAAAAKFGIDYEEMNFLHQFVFNIFEMGKISLDVYLDTVVFNVKRDFSRNEFKEFMFASSTQLPDTLSWLIEWKKKHSNIKVISINNEARELNQHRINTFNLHAFFDAFVSSCEVGMRKPDPEMFKLAIGIAQVKPEECLYFDDQPLLAEAAGKTGINAHHHESLGGMKRFLASVGL